MQEELNEKAIDEILDMLSMVKDAAETDTVHYYFQCIEIDDDHLETFPVGSTNTFVYFEKKF
ncbi:uncharacterized protein METZ01_LOCUS201660 [marine metagenome]|uniref:Uncharacterized protein n=1 Tax=marine metagenome TaxID=408172 RepID=A0A382EDD7_9ZZZZ